MTYYNVISNTIIAFRIINMESVCNYFSAVKFWHANWNLHIMRNDIWDSRCAVIELISSQLGLIRFYMLMLYHGVSGSTSPQAC